MTPAEIDRLRRLISEATPGPWRMVPPLPAKDTTASVAIVGEVEVRSTGPRAVPVADRWDAAFIAAFDPTTAAALLSAIAGLRRQLDVHLAMDEKVRRDFADAADDVHRAFCDPDHELVSPWDRDMAEALRARGYVISRAATERAPE